MPRADKSATARSLTAIRAASWAVLAIVRLSDMSAARGRAARGCNIEPEQTSSGIRSRIMRRRQLLGVLGGAAPWPA